MRPVAVVGSVGAGKTTLAHGLADALGYSLLSADAVRLRVAGDRAATDDPRVWVELARLADEMTPRVVLDSTGLALPFRRLVASLDCFVVRLECSWRVWQLREGRRGRTDVRYPLWRASTVGSRSLGADVNVVTDWFSPGRVLGIVLDEFGVV